MKKAASMFLLFFFMLPMYGFPCRAADDGVAGNFYYTDITTTIYTAPVNTLNIGGRTVIDAEALNWHYGFDVYWLPEERKLDITDKGNIFVSAQALSGSLIEEKKGAPGDVAGQYYYTDIKTYLNGKEIESYNIGGRTFIVAENMRDYGYDVDWNEENRTLSISKSKQFYVSKTELGEINLLYNPVCQQGQPFVMKLNRGIILEDNMGSRYELTTPSNCIMATLGGISYVALSDLEQIFHAECALEERIETEMMGYEFSYSKSYYTIHFRFDTNFVPDVREVAIYDYENEPIDLSAVQCQEISYQDVSLSINGERIGMPACYGGKIFQDTMVVIDGKLYVPTYVAAKLMHYAFAM